MKKVIYAWLITIVIGEAVMIAAEVNYYRAVRAVQKTDRTDADIEQTMAAYGFDVQWPDKITMKDKIKAIFK